MREAPDTISMVFTVGMSAGGLVTMLLLEHDLAAVNEITVWMSLVVLLLYVLANEARI